MKQPLTSAQEALAQELAAAITQASQDEILKMARTLVATDDATLFGNTEFEIRSVVLRIAAHAYQQHLAKKKTATMAPA